MRGAADSAGVCGLDSVGHQAPAVHGTNNRHRAPGGADDRRSDRPREHHNAPAGVSDRGGVPAGAGVDRGAGGGGRAGVSSVTRCALSSRSPPPTRCPLTARTVSAHPAPSKSTTSRPHSSARRRGRPAGRRRADQPGRVHLEPLPTVDRCHQYPRTPLGGASIIVRIWAMAAARSVSE